MTARTPMALLALACAGCSDSARVDEPEQVHAEWRVVTVRECEYVTHNDAPSSAWRIPLVHAGDCPNPAHRDTTGGRR